MTTTSGIPVEANTPRTRNRVFDNSPRMKAPASHAGQEWTLRKQIEADFRALGFRSHKFSHKNEPAERTADSLWLSWNSDNKKQPVGGAVTDIEVRVAFSEKENPHFIERETVITVTHDGRGRGGCIPRRMGKSVFIMDSTDTRDAVEHVKQLIVKPAI